MENLHRCAKIAVFVLQRIEAVRAGGDDLLDLVPLERRHVLHRLFLEQELFAQAPRRVAGTGFFVTEAGERHIRFLEQVSHCFGCFYRAGIGRTRAPNPEQIFEFFAVSGEGNIQTRHPILAVATCAPRVRGRCGLAQY